MAKDNSSIVDELKNQGDALYEKGQYKEAVEKYKAALSLDNKKESWFLGALYIKLGNAYYELKDLENYIKYYKMYLELYPDGQVAVFSRLAHAYYTIDMSKSIEYHDIALKTGINEYDATCKLFAMIKTSDYTQEEVRSEAEYQMKNLKSALYSDIKPYFTQDKKKAKKAGEKLNIGYLSSDCYTHIMMNYILPIWENHDYSKFNITIFNCAKNHDITTDKIIATGAKIVDCSDMTNEQLAKAVYDNDIDIFVDLGGFTHLRSTVHFYKPAPLAVSYLGYLNTMGMKEIDYILTHKSVIPEDCANLYTEKPLYLDCGYHVFKPSDNFPPVQPSPHEKNGYITFGVFNCSSKFSTAILYLWIKILQKVPTSKLLIYRTQMQKATIKRLQQVFEEAGISAGRIEYMTKSFSPHYNAYSLADIALDTYPFSGMSISMENALMGTPSITMTGEAMQSNTTSTINNACHIGSLIAKNGEEYVDIAVNLANDKTLLKIIHNNLRSNAMNSRICTKFKEFTLDLEDKYEKIWKEYSNS